MSANWKRAGIVAVAAFSVALVSQTGALAVKGGGGHTEVIGNNLSFPVIWGDSTGPGLSLPGTELEADLTVPWTEPTVEQCPDDMYPYAQKKLGNVWQAENELAVGPLYVDEIDWGDSLESVDMKIGRPVRVELSLYKTDLATPMTGFDMVMLANPSSKDEEQGVCASDLDSTDLVVTGDETTIASYDSYEATVFSPTAGLIIQQVAGVNLTWDAAVDKWVAGDEDSTAGDPISLVFSGELNVGGKVIYGLSQGGWKPTATGTYRITFFFPTDETQQTWFDSGTVIRASVAEEVSIQEEVEAGGVAVVDPANNLTYIDITVVGGGGGKPVR